MHVSASKIYPQPARSPSTVLYNSQSSSRIPVVSDIFSSASVTTAFVFLVSAAMSWRRHLHLRILGPFLIHRSWISCRFVLY